MPYDFDIIVIGAGPAGIAAATEAAKHGASVCVLDEQASPGGQIYRNVSHTNSSQAKILGPDYLAGKVLVDTFHQSDVAHRAGVTVWKLSEEGTVAFSEAGCAEKIQGRHIILANGAMERPVPLPGWTLPGVFTVGAAQILMKSGAIVARDAILVGSGPLLYLVASQLLAAGSPPRALIETQTSRNLIAAMPHFFNALKDWRQLLKGIGLIAALKWAGVPRFKAATDISIEGKASAEAVRFCAGGKEQRIETSIVLLHQGVVPNTQISRSLGLEHRYDSLQRCFHPVTNDLGQSSHPLFSIAGDGSGIGGAKVATLSGRISALNAVTVINKISASERDQATTLLCKARRAELSIRPFLDTLYPPPESVLLPADETIICRCEEVTAGDIRRYAALGCKGPNQTKSFGRSGMGPCQGRFCGLTVTEILAAETGETQDTVGSYRIRAPLKPVTLQELADLGV